MGISPIFKKIIVSQYLILFLLIPFDLKAQKVIFSLDGGFNFTTIIESNYGTLMLLDKDAASNNYNGYNPGVRYFLGTNFSHNFKNDVGVKLFAQFEERGEKNANILVNGTKGYTINNSYINIGFIFYYSLEDVIELGLGINNHILTSSKSIINAPILSFGSTSPLSGTYGIYDNYYFKNYLMSIPLQIAFKFKQTSRIKFVQILDIPLMNRLNNFDSDYKQLELTLQFGISIKVN